MDRETSEMEKRFKKLGLIGSSHVKRWPLELLRGYGLVPHKISFNPKTAEGVASEGNLTKLIDDIIENFFEVDVIIIFLGGNDINKECNPMTITQNIIKIADRIEEIGIKVIIMPVINREKPMGIEKEVYITIRNKINRELRKYYKTKGVAKSVINRNNYELDTKGVHLTYHSYKILSRVIANYLNEMTMRSLKTEGRHRLDSTEYSIQYFWQ